MNTDRNLLFGAIAMQCGLLTPDQFAQACATWSAGKGQSLLAICRDNGWPQPDDEAHVDYLVERRLARCGGDIRASVAACPAEVQSVLAGISNGTAGGPGLQTVDLLADRPGDVAVAQTGRRYALGQLHAAGGIGETWRARDTDLNREVAVKRLQSQKAGSAVHQTRFLREARITGQLDHPGVVPIYELCSTQRAASRTTPCGSSPGGR